MNVNGDIMKASLKLIDEGDFRGANSLLEPLLKRDKRKTLSPDEECDAVGLVGKNYQRLGMHKAALPFAMKHLELTIQLYEKGSMDHAIALDWVGQVQTELQDFKSAKKHFKDALAIYKDLGMEKSTVSVEPSFCPLSLSFSAGAWGNVDAPCKTRLGSGALDSSTGGIHQSQGGDG